MNRPILLPNARERLWGLCYLTFQVVFLPYLLPWLLRLTGSPLDSLTVNLLYFAFNLVVAGFVFRQFLMDTIQGVGGNWKTILLIAAAGFAVYYLMSILVNILILTLVPDFSNINDGSISEIGQKSRLLTAMGTVILVPTAEELLHRGAVFGSFYGKNRLAAYGISTVVFALVHISGYIGYHPAHILALCFLQYIPAGICLAASYEFSGNILTPILIHTAVNTVGILAMR